MSLTTQQRELCALLGLSERLVEDITSVPAGPGACSTCRQDPCVCATGPGLFGEEKTSPEEKAAKDVEAGMKRAQAAVQKDMRRGLNTKDDDVTLHPNTDTPR